MTVAQELLELADLIEKSQGLICMARNGRIIHLEQVEQISLSRPFAPQRYRGMK